jgi:hypothetical protein
MIPRHQIVLHSPTTLYTVSWDTSLPDSPTFHPRGPSGRTLTELLLHLLALLRGEELLGVVNELESGCQRGTAWVWGW